MKTPFKLLISTIINLGLCAHNQSTKSTNIENNRDTEPITLSLSTYNHAEEIYDGTWTYTISKNTLSIKRFWSFSKTDSLILLKSIDKGFLNEIAAINLETLADDYFNECVMITSGTEYDIGYTINGVTKIVHLHHFYLKQIDLLINKMNEIIPEKYKINYLPADTRQDCH